jgi:anti-sigma B factor antagonist
MPSRRPTTERPAGEGDDAGPQLAHGDLAEFSLFARAGTVIVDARGEIDLSNAIELTRAVEDAAAQGAVILDLTSVTFIDSTGVRGLFKLRRQLAETGTSFRVVVPPGAPIRRVLTLLDLPSAVPVDDCLDDALLRMQGDSGSNGGEPSA